MWVLPWGLKYTIRWMEFLLKSKTLRMEQNRLFEKSVSFNSPMLVWKSTLNFIGQFACRGTNEINVIYNWKSCKLIKV